jgi:hypothetical protein
MTNEGFKRSHATGTRGAGFEAFMARATPSIFSPIAYWGFQFHVLQ